MIDETLPTWPEGWKWEKDGWRWLENCQDEIGEALTMVDKQEIIKNLEKNHINIEENVEMMWYKWKNFHIELPAVWKFKWFKFDCFVSDEPVSKRDFKENSELGEQSYSLEDIEKLWSSLNEYLKENGTYWDANLYIRSFMNLHDSYRSKDEYPREFLEDDISDTVRVRNNTDKDSNYLFLNPNK